MKKNLSISIFIVFISFLIIVSLPVSAALKVGILPDADSIPLIVAESEGFFAESGSEIEIISFHNPIERDSALQAGEIDGAISDVLAVLFSVDNEQDVKITSLTNGRYVLLSGKNSGIKEYKDLKNVKIAVSSNTIIEYITDRLLKTNGFSEEEIKKIAIPKIPLRLQMLEAGKVKAACLPEPLASVLIKNGANKIGTSTELGEAPGIMLFTDKAVKNKGKSIENFYSAYSKAVDLLNKDSDKYRDLLIEKAGFPKGIKESFIFPEYGKPHLPEENTVNMVINWMEEKELINNNFKYQDIVDEKFVK
ncbi:MAG: ABC transporter substrate-binding protein [Bacillota bacterium]